MRISGAPRMWRRRSCIRNPWRKISCRRSSCGWRGKIDSPLKYLYRCVRNAALDYASTHTLRRWEELNGSELIADEVNFDLSRDDVERANRLHRLYQAIERLPEQSRRVVKLICLNNYSYADAASELGVSLATIKTHMYRSIKSLRKMMALFFF